MMQKKTKQNKTKQIYLKYDKSQDANQDNYNKRRVSQLLLTQTA